MNSFAALGFGLNKRETTCLTVAFALHSLLFLWTGGLLTLPTGDGVPLGDPLLQIGYMSDVPEYREPGAAGEEGRKRGIIGKVKQFFGGSAETRPSKKTVPDVATGNAIDQKIDGAVAKWEKTNSTLVDKNFSDKKNFKGIQANKEFAVVSGKETDAIVENKSVGTAASASPNLKEKSFQVSKSVPFKVASAKEMDSLSNVNMVPVTHSNQTSQSIKSLDSAGSGGIVGGGGLVSKSAGSAGGSGSSGGFSKAGARSGGGGSGESLAMGGAANGGGMIDTGGLGSGYSGSGTGGGGSTPGGMGSKRGGGGGQGGGSPYGTSGAIGNKPGLLPRRQLVEDTAVSNTSSSDMTITGELSRRPIKEKLRPPYEIDGRVALRFRVNASGKVLDGIVVEISSGSPTFDNKVVNALKQWVFSALPPEKSNVIQEGVITFIFRGE